MLLVEAGGRRGGNTHAKKLLWLRPGDNAVAHLQEGHPPAGSPGGPEPSLLPPCATSRRVNCCKMRPLPGRLVDALRCGWSGGHNGGGCTSGPTHHCSQQPTGFTRRTSIGEWLRQGGHVRSSGGGGGGRATRDGTHSAGLDVGLEHPIPQLQPPPLQHPSVAAWAIAHSCYKSPKRHRKFGGCSRAPT